MFSFMILENMFLLFFFFIGALQAVCPSGWLAWQDSCYIFLTEKTNWTQAEEACNLLGANLVVPNSKIEQDFVWLKFKTQLDMLATASDADDLWIGCKKTGEYLAGTLECPGVDGDPAYKNWKDNEPNSQDKCVRMADWYDGKWGDRKCSIVFFAACEMEAPCSRGAKKFHLVPRSCLVNHQIKSYPVKKSIECGLACWAEPLCRSFNLWKQAGDSKICQLNNATLLDAYDVTDIKNEENCFFYE